MKQKQIVVGLGLLVNTDNKILITLRNDPDSHLTHNKWEIPGGKVEFGETIQEAVIREMREEVGVKATIISDQPITASHVWQYPAAHIQVFLVGYLCTTPDTPYPANDETTDVKWVAPDDIAGLDFLPSCDMFVKKAAEYLSSRSL